MKNRFDLTGRTAVVTGGSRGLGVAFTRALARAGARVLISARDNEQLEKTATALHEETGAEILTISADLGDREQALAFAEHALAKLGHVDIFVGNAGTAHQNFADAATVKDIDGLLEVNFTPNVLLTTAFAPGMKERKWGRIIYLSSCSAHASSDDGHSLYAATKAALEAYARTAAVEFGLSGITVNCIAPGVFMTDLPKQRFDAMAPDLAEKIYNSYADMTAIGRWGDPSELEAPLLLLASDAGSYITGTVLHVDGGMTIRARPRDR